MDGRFPSYVRTVMEILLDGGHQAYVVGGAVRDLLLGIEPGDFDVTTDARPERVKALLEQAGVRVVDNLGQNLGVVVAVVDHTPVEIATFRGERYGADPHRPEEVWFCDSLKEDMSRRDFTVNAMALDADGKLYDYFGGREDLERKLLRTVGKAERRYAEDALRMYRACRFVAQLGFTYVEEGDDGASAGRVHLLPEKEGETGFPAGKDGFGERDTPYYLPKRYTFDVSNCRELSVERVRKELDKMLTSAHAGKGLMLFVASGLAESQCRIRENGEDTYVDVLPELKHLTDLHQNKRFHCYDAWEHTLLALDNGSRELAVRWALLLHDVGKGMPGIRQLNKQGLPSDHGHEAVSAIMAEKILTRLRYPADFVKRVCWLISRHMRFAPMLITGRDLVERWVRTEAMDGFFRDTREMTEAYEQLVEVFLGDMGATWAGVLKEPVMADGVELGKEVINLAARMPVHTSDLEIGGREVKELLDESGIWNVGDALKYLLTRVQSGNLANSHDLLRQGLERRLQKLARGMRNK